MNLLLGKLLFALLINSSFFSGMFLTITAPEEIYPGRKILKNLLIVFLLFEVVVVLNIREWNVFARFLTYVGLILLIYAKKIDIKKIRTYYIAIIFFAIMVFMSFKNDNLTLKILLTSTTLIVIALFEINLIYVRFEKYFKRKNKNLSNKIENKIKDNALVDFLITFSLTMFLLIIF